MEKEIPLLSDKEQFPLDEIIFNHIGKSKQLWISLFEQIHTNHPDITAEWRYYNDGKSWLLKVTRKSKTICWVSILKNSFRMTFYFGDKAEKAVLDSSIPNELKSQFRTGKRFGKIRGLTIIFKSKKDVEYAKALIDLKRSLK